jgi:hypothetical protein
MKPLRFPIPLIIIGLTLTACSNNQSDSERDLTKETFSINTLVEELKHCNTRYEQSK